MIRRICFVLFIIANAVEVVRCYYLEGCDYNLTFEKTFTNIPAPKYIVVNSKHAVLVEKVGYFTMMKNLNDWKKITNLRMYKQQKSFLDKKRNVVEFKDDSLEFKTITHTYKVVTDDLEIFQLASNYETSFVYLLSKKSNENIGELFVFNTERPNIVNDQVIAERVPIFGDQIIAIGVMPKSIFLCEKYEDNWRLLKLDKTTNCYVNDANETPDSSVIPITTTPKVVTTPKIIPTTPKIIPTTPKIIPTTPKIIPTTPKIIPTTPKIIPTTPKIIPTIPKASEPIATIPKNTVTKPTPTIKHPPANLTNQKPKQKNGRMLSNTDEEFKSAIDDMNKLIINDFARNTLMETADLMRDNQILFAMVNYLQEKNIFLKRKLKLKLLKTEIESLKSRIPKPEELQTKFSTQLETMNNNLIRVYEKNLPDISETEHIEIEKVQRKLKDCRMGQ